MDFRNQTDLPRGIRNNNPGNLKTGQGWKGVVGNDGTFDIFSDDTWGLRALAMDLTAKINRGLNTVASIISVYAPPSENNTAAYISAVSASTGLGPDDPITTPLALGPLMRAIVMHENGDQGGLVSDADIQQGVSMMGNGVSTLVQATTDAIAETDPTMIGLVIGGGVLLLILLSMRKGR